MGGLWLACHAGFRAEGNDPVPEVMRLGLSCGPQNGMRRRGGTLRGEVSAQGTPARRRFPVLAGECFRLVIVGQASLASWKVALTLPDRAAIEVAVASEDGRPGYAVVERERPFCATTGGGAELVVTAEVGAGTFAAQIWGMPPRGSP